MKRREPISENVPKGKRIAQARERAGLTQQNVADALKLSNGAVGQWEIGMVYPTRKNEAKLAKLLEVSTSWIRTGKDAEISINGLRHAKRIVGDLRQEMTAITGSVGVAFQRGYRAALKDVENRIVAAMVDDEE